MANPFAAASEASLRAVADAIRAGRVVPPFPALAIERVVHLPAVAIAEIARLGAEGCAPHHLAFILDLAADAGRAATTGSACELVWTGPEGPGASSRDTVVVLDELFAEARERITISTFVVRQAKQVLASLARRLDEDRAVEAALFIHVPRGMRDERHESELLREFTDDLRKQWPGQRRPAVFYDPRSLSDDAAVRATWHAKCAIVDSAVAFVTSANFTEWAQSRNVEAGVLIRDPHFARQLQAQFDWLVVTGAVIRLPGI